MCCRLITGGVLYPWEVDTILTKRGHTTTAAISNINQGYYFNNSRIYIHVMNWTYCLYIQIYIYTNKTKGSSMSSSFQDYLIAYCSIGWAIGVS